VAALSDWLQLMLAEMARKREEEARSRAEQLVREREEGSEDSASRSRRSSGNLTPD
jgi:hypothetical protein